MSFFKDLKEDIGTAMGEFGDDDNQMVDTLSGLETDGFDEFELSEEDSFGVDKDMIDRMEAEAAEEAAVEESVAEAVFTEPVVESYVAAAESSAAVEAESTAQFGTDSVTVQKVDNLSVPTEDSGITTVISKGTVINGSIVSDGSLEVFGTVNGDISCLGKLSISGAVKGKSSAAEVYLNTNRLDGGITSKGSVKIGVGTVVIGDVTASSCVVAGAVKGDLDVNGPVIVDSTAVIKGNINSKGIQINSGAIIDGFCALPYASIDIDSYFGEEV